MAEMYFFKAWKSFFRALVIVFLLFFFFFFFFFFVAVEGKDREADRYIDE